MWSSSKLRAEMFSITEWMTHRFKCLKFSFIALLRAFEISISLLLTSLLCMVHDQNKIQDLSSTSWLKNALKQQEDVLIKSLSSFYKLYLKLKIVHHEPPSNTKQLQIGWQVSYARFTAFLCKWRFWILTMPKGSFGRNCVTCIKINCPKRSEVAKHPQIICITTF